MCELKDYFGAIDRKIKHILQRPERSKFTFDILDTEKTKRNKMIVLKEKQRQMKIGEIWQEVLGNYDSYESLYRHPSGLDILSHTRKIAIELKNRTNTDNYSSKKSNLDKLAAFKKENPDYICIYANINAETEEKTMRGSSKIIMHNDMKIYHMTGYLVIQYILQEYADEVVEFVKETIDKYS